jgi:hypothetical protein
MTPLDPETKAACLLLQERSTPTSSSDERTLHLVTLASSSQGRFGPEDLQRLYHPFTERGPDVESFLSLLVSTRADGWDAWSVRISDREAFASRLRLEPFQAPRRERKGALAD